MDTSDGVLEDMSLAVLLTVKSLTLTPSCVLDILTTSLVDTGEKFLDNTILESDRQTDGRTGLLYHC